MSDKSVVYFSETAAENVNEWGDNDDLQALMHAAADADARDNEEALIQEQQTSEEQPTSPPPECTAPALPQVSHKRKHSPKRTSVNDNSHKNEFSGYYSKGTDRGCEQKHKSEEESPKRLKTNDGQAHARPEGHANVVAAHYNMLEEKGLDERLKSRIFYMRNFNNWIKSMLINEYLNKVKEGMKHNSAVRVMDMCCGKGGDLFKWRKGNISYLICTDIAAVSLEQCESRYRDMCGRSGRDRNAGRVYRAEFIPADSGRTRLRERFADPSIRLDLVSCQFAFHYSFESLPQAECMIRNAAECLNPGGFFIGTIPDANEILARQRAANATTFGNDIYQITFHCDPEHPPLFGAKYNFHLEGVVDCPEFLVHFPTFVKLARNYGLQLVKVERFGDLYERLKSEGFSLLQKMQCLETYPPWPGAASLGTTPDDYRHAEDFIAQKDNANDQKVGTLSKSEWEAVSLYLTFAFCKVKTIWDANGKPQYEFR